MHIVIGGLGLTLGILFIAAVAFSLDPAHRDIAAGFAWIFSGLAIVYFIPSLTGGIGLLKGWTWARGVIWLESALLAPLVPVGTAMAGFALWALLTSQPVEVRPGEEMFLRLEARLRSMMRPMLIALAAVATLGAMIGVGWLFRDQIEALQPKQELTPLPSGRPAGLEH